MQQTNEPAAASGMRTILDSVSLDCDWAAHGAWGGSAQTEHGDRVLAPNAVPVQSRHELQLPKQTPHVSRCKFWPKQTPHSSSTDEALHWPQLSSSSLSPKQTPQASMAELPPKHMPQLSRCMLGVRRPFGPEQMPQASRTAEPPQSPAQSNTAVLPALGDEQLAAQDEPLPPHTPQPSNHIFPHGTPVQSKQLVPVP